MTPANADDDRWMAYAVELAARADWRTRPNPPVGCVLVLGDRIVGQGWHVEVGGPHAEVAALKDAKDAAVGSTAYVTLEPCNHTGRTGPCTEALIAAGVKRVVVGCRDPNPPAAGGAAYLAANGIAVTTGVLQQRCHAVAEDFFARIAHQRPYFRLKLAATLDGKTAAADGTSQWITGSPARRRVHQLRADADAVVVGSGTVLADNPQLTVRHVATSRQPTRVVLDRRLRCSPDAAVFDTRLAPSILCTTTDHPLARTKDFRVRGVDVIAVDQGKGDFLEGVAHALQKRRIYAVFCEPGATLAGALIRANLVDRVDVMVGAKLLGQGRDLLGDIGAHTIDAARSVTIDRAEKIGDDVWISAVLDGRGI